MTDESSQMLRESSKSKVVGALQADQNGDSRCGTKILYLETVDEA